MYDFINVGFSFSIACFLLDSVVGNDDQCRQDTNYNDDDQKFNNCKTFLILSSSRFFPFFTCNSKVFFGLRLIKGIFFHELFHFWKLKFSIINYVCSAISSILDVYENCWPLCHAELCRKLFWNWCSLFNYCKSESVVIICCKCLVNWWSSFLCGK